MMGVNNLFTKYSRTFSTKQDGEERQPMDARGQQKSSRHELRGLDGQGAPQISKRGGNFLDRIVCWFEKRVFSLTRSGKHASPRQQASGQFAHDVEKALAEIGLKPAEGADAKPHELVQRIESVRKRDLPLRSGFVRGILQEVAGLTHGADQGAHLPVFARVAFPAPEPVVPPAPEPVAPNREPVVRDREPDAPAQRERGAEPVDGAAGKQEIRRFVTMSDGEFHRTLAREVHAHALVPHLNDENNRAKHGRFDKRVFTPDNLDAIASDATHALLRRKFGEAGALMAAKRRADEINNEAGGGEEAVIPRLCLEICAGNEGRRAAYFDDCLARLNTQITGVQPPPDPAVPQEPIRRPRSVAGNEPVDGTAGRREISPFGEESSGIWFFTMLSERVKESVIGPYLDKKDLRGFHEQVLQPANVDSIARDATDSLLKQKFGNDEPLQAAKMRANAIYNEPGGGREVAVPRLCEEICQGNEIEIGRYVDEYLGRLNAQITGAQLPPGQADAAYFMVQDDNAFKEGLRDPVKTKVVNPVLRGLGFYDGNVTAKETAIADRIVSAVVGDVLAVSGSVEATKRKAQESLELLGFSVEPGDDRSVLPNRALDAVVDQFLETDGEQARVFVQQELEYEMGKQAPPPQEIPQEAPEMVENLQPDFNEAAQRIQDGGIQVQAAEAGAADFMAQDDNVFKEGLRDPVKTKVVNPVLRELGFYDGEMTDEKTETADRIVSVMVGNVVAAYGNVEATKQVAKDALALVEFSVEPGDDRNVLPNRALGVVVDQFLATNGDRAKELVRGELDPERGRQAPLPQEIPQEVPEVEENPQPDFNEAVRGAPGGEIQVQAAEQKGGNEVASFRDMPVDEFLERLSAQVKTQYVIPEARKLYQGEAYSDKVALRDDMVTAAATAGFVTGVMGSAPEQIKEHAAGVCDGERHNYAPNSERRMQDDVLKELCTNVEPGGKRWMSEQVRVAFGAYQDRPGQDNVNIGQMILANIVPVPRQQTGGDGRDINYAGPAVPQGDGFDQPVGPGVGRGTPIPPGAADAQVVPALQPTQNAIPEAYKLDMMGNFVIKISGEEVGGRLRAAAIERAQQSGYGAGDIDTPGNLVNTAFAGVLNQGRHITVAQQLFGAAIDQYNRDLGDGHAVDWDIAAETEKATRTVVRQFAFEFEQNLAQLEQ